MTKLFLTIASTIFILSRLGKQQKRIRELEADLTVAEEIGESALNDLQAHLLTSPLPARVLVMRARWTEH